MAKCNQCDGCGQYVIPGVTAVLSFIAAYFMRHEGVPWTATGVIAFIGFVAGLYFVDWIRDRRRKPVASASFPTETTDQIIHLNKIPTEPRWTLTDKDPVKLPKFKLEMIPGLPSEKALRIDIPEGNTLTFDLQYERKDINSVDFLGHFNPDSLLYVRMVGRDHNGKEARPLWFCISRGNKPPERHAHGREWSLWLTPKLDKTAEDWERVSVEVQKTFAQTFGSDGYEFVGVDGIRFRRTLTIGSVAFRGS